MRTRFDYIGDNLACVTQQIEDAARKYQREASAITLIAVSKKKSADLIQRAVTQGQLHFGESYAQEATEKIEQLPFKEITWHFIGPIQKNKTRLIAENFHWVHSIDRPVIAQRLSNQRDPGLPKLNVCIQVNIDDEDSKSGISPSQISSLATTIQSLPNLELRGLMAIPSRTDSFAQQQASFHQVKLLFEEMQAQGYAVDTLSMGMSNDLAAAISEGATMVRVGTAIFGSRDGQG